MLFLLATDIIARFYDAFLINLLFTSSFSKPEGLNQFLFCLALDHCLHFHMGL
jgi:hypothetical protein